MSTLKYIFFIAIIIFVSLFAAKNMHTVEKFIKDQIKINVKEKYNDNKNLMTFIEYL